MYAVTVSMAVLAAQISFGAHASEMERQPPPLPDRVERVSAETLFSFLHEVGGSAGEWVDENLLRPYVFAPYVCEQVLLGHYVACPPTPSEQRAAEARAQAQREADRVAAEERLYQAWLRLARALEAEARKSGRSVSVEVKRKSRQPQKRASAKPASPFTIEITRTCESPACGALKSER